MRLALLVVLLGAIGCDAFAGAESELTGAGGSSTRSSSSASAMSGGMGGKSPSTSATGGSSSTSGAGAGMEDCTNGIDDNGDGLVDCEDPQCSDFACVDAPPAGWTMPGAFYYGIAGTVPPCPMNDPKLAISGNGELMYQPVSCETCSCGMRTGQSCNAATVSAYDSAAGCTGAATHTIPVAFGKCTIAETSFFGNTQSVITSTNYVAGSCAKMGGEKLDTPMPTFAKVGEVCAPITVGKCTQATSVCAPKVGGEFETSVCISHPDDVDCLSSYTNKTVIYAGVTDTRDCAACDCDLPANDCTAPVTYWQGGNGDCGATVSPGTPNSSSTGQCDSLTNVMSVKAGAVSWPSQNTQCTPSGGGATGKVVGSQATTVCCH